jgi:hypothetical protein
MFQNFSGLISVYKRYPKIISAIMAPIIYHEEIFISKGLDVTNKIVALILYHFISIQKYNGLYKDFVRIIL